MRPLAIAFAAAVLLAPGVADAQASIPVPALTEEEPVHTFRRGRLRSSGPLEVELQRDGFVLSARDANVFFDARRLLIGPMTTAEGQEPGWTVLQDEWGGVSARASDRSILSSVSIRCREGVDDEMCRGRWQLTLYLNL